MNYLTTQDFAFKWKTKASIITYLCRTNKINGAIKKGKTWLIPEDASLPADGRKKSSLQKKLLPLPIGISSYKEAVSKYFYIDKTMMIKEIIDDCPKVSLFTRPRRFGKTLNMDMLRVFFEKTEEDTSLYFSSMNIWKQGEKYQKYQGKYPVIFITFKDVKFANWDETFEKIKEIFQAEFLRHLSIIQENCVLSQQDIDYFNAVINKQVSKVELTSALQNLSKMLFLSYGIAPIIIIDEYDTPIQQGYTLGYYDEIISFMRNLFSGGFKDNPHLSFGFLTGILRVAKESIFSGLNNLIDNSVLSNHYSNYFGFTHEEVQMLLHYYGRDEKYSEVCDWYDGYLFGKTEIFNPWSVINYIYESCEPKAYWQNTGSNDVLRKSISHAPLEMIEQLQALLEGQTIMADLDNFAIYPEIQDNPQTIFSFLLVAGYLKIVNKCPSPTGNAFCEVAIPNKEIQCIYGKEILSSINNTAIQSSATSIQQAIMSQNADALQKHLQKYLTQTISFLDTDKEGFFEELMLGLYATFNNLYSIKSNRESGNGRFDIQMEPFNKHSAGILVELKVFHPTKEETESTILDELKKLSNVALNQISKMHYEQELLEKGIHEILEFGIAFYKKQTAIAFQKLQ